MKKLRRCRVTLMLVLGLTVLSVVGYLGRDTVYQNYRKDLWRRPYFSLVFAGLHDGILPWSGQAYAAIVKGGDHGIPEKTDVTDLLMPEAEASLMQPSWESIAPEGAGTEEPVPEEAPVPRRFITVDETYFDDALFIGDSRTVGLRDYGGLDNAVFYASVGLTIYNLWTDVFCEVDGKKCTLEDALAAQQFGKIYIQIGINEMGRGTLDGFIAEYEATVGRIRTLQPAAIIYVQGIMCVAQQKSDSDAIFNNLAIRERNARLAELADGREIFYIDMNEVVCDAQGNLMEELTFDDLHLYGSKYDIWVDYLLTKGIDEKLQL